MHFGTDGLRGLHERGVSLVELALTTRETLPRLAPLEINATFPFLRSLIEMSAVTVAVEGNTRR
jgi:hypothetical protein